jgi:hypothetical protein
MIRQRRVKLDFFQAIFHYSFPLFILAMPFFSLFFSIKDYFTHTVADPERSLLHFDLFIIALSILSAFIQWRKLRFREYKVSLTSEDFEEALSRTKRSENWIITNHRKQFIQAIRPDELAGERIPILNNDAGEMITIIKLPDSLLINSISDPNMKSASLLGRQNRTNISIFIANLRDVIKHIPEKVTIPETPEKEWTLKKIIVRLLLYPLCLSLITIGIWLIIETKLKAIIPSGLIIAGASIYLYTDLMIITKRKSSNSTW